MGRNSTGEKSFLDPSHSLGMTALGPSPWRPLPARAPAGGRSLREIQSYSEFPSFQNFKYVWLEIYLDHGTPRVALRRGVLSRRSMTVNRNGSGLA